MIKYRIMKQGDEFRAEFRCDGGHPDVWIPISIEYRCLSHRYNGTLNEAEQAIIRLRKITEVSTSYVYMDHHDLYMRGIVS
jgi:hypothetical protein